MNIIVVHFFLGLHNKIDIKAICRIPMHSFYNLNEPTLYACLNFSFFKESGSCRLQLSSQAEILPHSKPSLFYPKKYAYFHFDSY